MKTLLLLAHATDAVRARYQSAGGANVRVVTFIAPPISVVAGGGLSSRYTALAARLRRRPGDPILPGLLSFLGVERWEYDRVILAWYSAGYSLTRELAASEEDRAAIAAWIGIDGGHAPNEADGTPEDRSVGWLATLARDAAEGRTVLAYGHSDVRPGAYASTKATIDEALRLAGVSVAERQAACPGCRLGFCMSRSLRGLLVEAHDHRLDPVQEHVDALSGWGDEFVARALHLARETARDPLEQNGHFRGCGTKNLNDSGSSAGSSTLGELALQAALAELQAGAAEDPRIRNGGATVRRYLSGCVRGGRRVGITVGEWCAAFAGWCDSMAIAALRATGAEVPAPCQWRAAVWELVDDARAGGAWRERDEYSPLPGDLAVFGRQGQDPRKRGHLGHVGRVETPPGADRLFPCIEGNSGSDGRRVARVERSTADPQLLGWIAYPRPPALPTYHVEASELAAGLDETARQLLGGA